MYIHDVHAKGLTLVHFITKEIVMYTMYVIFIQLFLEVTTLRGMSQVCTFVYMDLSNFQFVSVNLQTCT